MVSNRSIAIGSKYSRWIGCTARQLMHRTAMVLQDSGQTSNISSPWMVHLMDSAGCRQLQHPPSSHSSPSHSHPSPLLPFPGPSLPTPIPSSPPPFHRFLRRNGISRSMLERVSPASILYRPSPVCSFLPIGQLPCNASLHSHRCRGGRRGGGETRDEDRPSMRAIPDCCI